MRAGSIVATVFLTILRLCARIRETANWRGLERFTFLGWLASEFRLCTVELRQFPAESSESLEYWNRGWYPEARQV